MLGKKDEHEKVPDLMVSPLDSKKLPWPRRNKAGDLSCGGAVNRAGNYCHRSVCYNRAQMSELHGVPETRNSGGDAKFDFDGSESTGFL